LKSRDRMMLMVVFLSLPRQMLGQYLKLGHDQFHPHVIQFIVHNLVASYSFVVHSTTVDDTVKHMCTRFLHTCSALCKCASWLCRTCTPHHTVAGRSPVSPFAFPSNCRCGPPLTSYMPGRCIPFTRARHSSTYHRTLCAVHGLCTSAVKRRKEGRLSFGFLG
jgi:hypothetical protein